MVELEVVLQRAQPVGQLEQSVVPPVEVSPAGQAVQEELAKPKSTLQDWQVTVPLLFVLQVAHPEGQVEQLVTAPPAEVVPAAQAVQEALTESSKLGLQVWHETVPLLVVQLAHPLAQAEQVAVPPADVCPVGQAVQAVPFYS